MTPLFLGLWQGRISWQEAMLLTSGQPEAKREKGKGQASKIPLKGTRSMTYFLKLGLSPKGWTTFQ
jgi:hypothetical protein